MKFDSNRIDIDEIEIPGRTRVLYLRSLINNPIKILAEIKNKSCRWPQICECSRRNIQTKNSVQKLQDSKLKSVIKTVGYTNKTCMNIKDDIRDPAIFRRKLGKVFMAN